MVYVGTFSKSLLPALRIGFLVPPRSLLPALREAKRVTTWEGDLTTQGALAEFLAEGHHAAHVRRAHTVYRERRDLRARRAGAARRRPARSCRRWPGCTWPRGSATRASTTGPSSPGRRSAGVRVEALSDHHRAARRDRAWRSGFAGIEADAVPDAIARLEPARRSLTGGAYGGRDGLGRGV